MERSYQLSMARLERVWGRQRSVAASYDWGVHNPVVGRVFAQGWWGAKLDDLIAAVARVREAPAGSRVLDVPCGGGLAFPPLQYSARLDYTALDLSPVMLERAARRAHQLGLDTIRFQQGDVSALPFADASFDLALTFNGLHCFADPHQALRELARVLVPGGRLRGTACLRGEGARFDALQAVFRELGFFGPCCTRAQLASWLEHAGMTVLHLEASGALVTFEALRL
jgi:ubiquinone/menaquinone biosynthesis C-methylase UbiE